MRHRDVHRQQQAEAAELDAGERPQRRAVRARRPNHAAGRRSPSSSAAKHERACQVVPRSRHSNGASVASAGAPAGEGHQQPDHDARLPSPARPAGSRAGRRTGRCRPARSASARSRASPSSAGTRQQEAEDETRQHLVLHHERMQPAGVGRAAAASPNTGQRAATSHAAHHTIASSTLLAPTKNISRCGACASRRGDSASAVDQPPQPPQHSDGSRAR